MRMIGTMVVLLSMGAVTGCSSNTLAPDPNWPPLHAVFKADGCPADVPPDNSCANVVVVPPAQPVPAGSVCRKNGHKIVWQAVDANHNPIQIAFAVRFKPTEEILDPDSRDRKCFASKNGLLKCKVKNGSPADPGRGYKYVVQVGDTECQVLDPRVYVD